MDKLVEGYRRFRREGWEGERDRWETLIGGQTPRIMVIACSDSRVDPATIFDTSPGEMFVVRNVANLVPPFEEGGGRHGVSAALEFAVTQLEVPQILVMGHGGCGGVRAALTKQFAGAPAGQGGFIDHWVDLLDAPRDRILAQHSDRDTALRAMELETVRTSIANLRTFPFVPPREAAGTLKLIGGYFALAEGVLYLLDDESGAFVPA